MTKIEFPQRPVAFLIYFLKSLTAWQKISIFLLMFITAVVVSSNFVMIYGFKLLIDLIPEANPNDIWLNLAWPFWIIVVCCLIHTIFLRVRDFIDANSTPYVMNALREMLMGNITRHSHDYFHNRFSGELVNKVNNISSSYRNILWDRFIHGFIPTISAIISSFVLLWFIDIILALTFIAIIGGMILSVYFLGGYMGRASANLADREADISGQLVDTITNISSVKNFAQQSHEINLLKHHQIPYVSAYKRFVKWEIIFWLVFDIFICGLIIGAVWYLIGNYSNGNLSAGDLAVAVLIAWDIWYRMAFLSWNLVALSGDLGKMQSALNEFVRPISVEDKANAPIFTPKDGVMKFKHVAFHYDSGHQVFKNFSLEIPSSQKIGVVGLSGAGKTTLCQLLLRNYDLQGGEIIIGNQNIADVTQSSLRKNIAVIPQDPTLFHRSLYENILYGKPEATKDEVIAASIAAQAHDFILSTQEGYETTVGERGVKLSGGQRQRIAIARAILKNAPILILDEATSALDSDTERLIQTALNHAMEGRTTIVVAHRLSTLAHLDRIIVMKDGIIIEDGNLQQLIEANGHFAYLWNLQAGGFLPEKL
jgi:ATP-binding cassette subfamily B protein